MAKCKPFFIENVNEILAQKIIGGIGELGADITGDNPYFIKARKITLEIEATWNESEETLSIEIIKRRRIVPCSLIENKIRSGIEKAREEI